MEKTTLYLPAGLQHSLRAAALRLKKSQAEVIREALGAYLQRRSPVLPASIGAASAGRVSGAKSEEWIRKNWKPR